MGVGSGVFPRFPAAASSRSRGPSAKTTAHTFGSSAGRKLLVRKRTSASRTCYILPRPRQPQLLPGEQRSHLLLVSVRAANRIGHSRAEAPQQRGFTHAPRDRRCGKNALPTLCSSCRFRAWRNQRLVHRKPIGVDGGHRYYLGSRRAEFRAASRHLDYGRT